MARKLFSRFQAVNDGGQARLSWYLTTPFYQEQAVGERDWSALPVRIHRIEAAGFVWGRDYEEYFDALDLRDADVIFDGPFDLINKRKYEFVDADVSLRTSYAYWVSAGDVLPTGPVPIRIADPEVWWPRTRVEAELDDLAALPGCTVEPYGDTALHRPLRGFRLGNPGRCIAMLGTIHAGESGPELILPLAKRLTREEPELLAKVGLAALPTVNVEERERIVRGTSWYLRSNANGVDLNRNFDADWDEVDYGYGLKSDDPDANTYRGPAPHSEAETRAVVRFLETTQPETVFACHWLASICGTGMLAPKKAEGDEAYAVEARRFVGAYRRGFENNSEASDRFGYGTTAGSMALWCYRKLGIPAFDLEGNVNVLEEKLCQRDQTTPEIVAEYQERHYRGVRAVLRMLAA